MVEKIDVLFIEDVKAIDIDIDKGNEIKHVKSYCMNEKEKALRHAERIANKYNVKVNIVEDYIS